MELIKKTNGNTPTLTSVFDEFFNMDPFDWSGWRKVGSTSPAVNVSETENDYKVEVAAPGMKKEDFNIRVDNNNMLTISSEKKIEDEDKDGDYTRREFSYTAFTRSFHLPDTADDEHIEAKYNDGILHLTIPKKEEAKTKPTRVIDIK